MRVRAVPVLLVTVVASAWGQGPPAAAMPLRNASLVERSLGPSDFHDYTLRLGRGMSVTLDVQQLGIDVVVEVRGSDGRLLDAIDGPTGRAGLERAEIFADRASTYGVRIRPYSGAEPEGRYAIAVAIRNSRATTALVAMRARARAEAATWLRRHAVTLTSDSAATLPPLDALASAARVIGLGEATHGSRELADLRFATTRYLVQRHGVRLIAVESSASRLAILDAWARGEPIDEATLRRALDSGWIGRRTLGDLVRWLRSWNGSHPTDRVRLVGVDPQDNAIARDTLRDVLARGYGEEGIAGLASAFEEIAIADSQAAVFGDSRVSEQTHRTLLEIVARLEVDASLLSRQLGVRTVEAARDVARQLVQFAQFNAGGPATRSRDWYMAANLVRALDAAPTGARAVFWSHNAHIAVSVGRTSGGYLRAALGCGYRALATSFGAGSFVAQRPNDLEDRLATTALSPAPAETIDGVLRSISGNPLVAAWSCDPRPGDVPPWLQSPQSLHWVGGLFDPGSLPSDAFRPFTLVQDFDGVFYLPQVTADQLYADRPLVAPRQQP